MYNNKNVSIEGNKVKLTFDGDNSRFIYFYLSYGQIEATLMHDFIPDNPQRDGWDAERNSYPYDLHRVAETGDLIEDSLDWMVFTHERHDEAFSFIEDRVLTVLRVLIPEIPFWSDDDIVCIVSHIFRYYLGKTYGKTREEVIDLLFAEIFSVYNDEKMKEKFLLSKKMILA